MTSEDVMKFCEKGSHEYKRLALLLDEDTDKKYILMKCQLCPSRWVDDF